MDMAAHTRTGLVSGVYLARIAACGAFRVISMVLSMAFTSHALLQ
jgi:hypothetical protein